MYNDDFNNEEEQSSKNKLLEFYENNKILILILIVLLVIFLVFSTKSNNKENDVVIPNIELSDNSKVLRIGSQDTITINVTNSNQLDSSLSSPVVWTSSDTNIVTVKDGLIYGVSYGTAIITATYVYNNQTYIKTCNVVVADGDSNISLTKAGIDTGLAIYMGINNTYTIPVNYEPSNGLVTSRDFVSNNSNIAKVDQSGVVTGISVGTATINLKVNNTFSSSIKVIVKDTLSISNLVKLPDTINFEKDSYDVTIDEKINLDYSTSPSNINSNYLEFTSSDTNIATVSSTGVVSGLKEGTVTITVQTLGSTGQVIMARCTVNVKSKTKLVSNIAIESETNFSMVAGGISTIIYTVYPDDATNKDVSFTSSNSSVAKVNSYGEITGVSEGSTVITVKSKDGSDVTKKVKVTIVKAGSSSDGSLDIDCGYIKITSDVDAIFKTAAESQSKVRTAPATVTINKQACEKVTYCMYEYGSRECTNMITYTTPFKVYRKNVTTVLKYTVYSKSGANRTDYRYLTLK